MAEELNRLSRLISLLTILQTKALITSTELSERYDVSVRTIYRDIRSLQDAGIPIYTIEGRGYSLMKNYKLAPVSFSEEEANALITAEKIISKNRDESLRKNYSKAIDKIKAVLKHEFKDKAAILAERMMIVGDASHTNSDLLSKIQHAITNWQFLNIDYISFYKSEHSSRKIEPKALYSTRNNWILIAYCYKQMAFREFRLDRIVKMEILEKIVEIRDFDLKIYFREKIKQFDTPDKPLSK